MPYVIFGLSVSHCGFRYLCFFAEKPICSSPRYYSVSARIRTWRRPLISSIKQRKRRNIVGLQFRFAVPLSWHEIRPLGGDDYENMAQVLSLPQICYRGPGLPVPAIKTTRPCPLNTNKMFAPGGIDNGS